MSFCVAVPRTRDARPSRTAAAATSGLRPLRERTAATAGSAGAYDASRPASGATVRSDGVGRRPPGSAG